MERSIFNLIEVYESNTIIGVHGETSFHRFDLAVEYFVKMSDKLNDSFNTVYLVLN